MTASTTSIEPAGMPETAARLIARVGMLLRQCRARREHLARLRRLQDLDDHLLRDIGMMRDRLEHQERALRRLF